MSRSTNAFPVVLASSSSYRKALLERLGLVFDCRSPNIDERVLDNETIEHAVKRLAIAKAAAVAASLDTGIVIGSDQLATCGTRVLGKPGNRSANIAQLQTLSGQRVQFLTGVCVWCKPNRSPVASVVPFEVRFRVLSYQEIERYVDAERPYDCTGGFKCEGLGISLLQSMSGDDPTALIGLPLIRLSQYLREFGVQLP